MLIVTLLSIVFMQMEERRLGYEILKLTREQRSAIEKKRLKTIQLAKSVRPDQIEKSAQKKNLLKKVEAKQIIHLTGAPLSVEASKEIQ